MLARKLWHSDITDEAIVEAVARMYSASLEDPGFCLACGAEVSVASFCLIMTYFAGVAAAAGGWSMLVGFIFGALACLATATVTIAGEECDGRNDDNDTRR